MGRRAAGATRRLPDFGALLTARVGAKALAGAGLAVAVAATVTLPVEAAPALLSAPSVTATPDASVSAARLGDLADGSASRSQARTPIAVQAPQAPGPRAAATFGVAGVTAVAKPKPAPTPSPTTGADQKAESGSTAQGSGSSGSSSGSSSSSSSSNSGGYSSGAYASAGRAIGLGPTAQRVYSAIRSQFGITNIGGYRSGDSGDHGSGRAVDVMTSSFAQGDAVAAFVQAHAGEFNVKYVIWKQRIWFPGSGWRHMSDRGSATANHYDHVHISVN
jgi:hypothetical protein